MAVAVAAVFGGEAWWASRGRALGAPAPAPADSAIGPPGEPRAVAVWLGDSTAAGVGASGPATILPEQVAQRLGGRLRLTDLARSGARVADVVNRQLPQLARLAPNEVFISVGANDATHLTARPRFRHDYQRLLSGLPASVTKVVLLGVPDLGAAPRLPHPLREVAGWRGRALASDIRHLAHRYRAVFVDVAARTGPSFRRDPGRYFAPDRYHPNDAGYNLWAGAVADAMAGPQQSVPAAR